MIEKLIELLNKAHSHLNSTCIGHGCDSCAYGSYDDCAERIEAEYLIANGVPVQKWIPVAERLPEKCEPVLVCFDFMGGKAVKASDRYGKNGLLWSGIPCGGKVTHWMPLPEPPKGE